MSQALQGLPESLRGRVRPAPVPRTFAPMKAVLVDQPFSDDAWLFERKLDGVRCAAFREAGAVRLVSRSGRNVSGTYPELVEGLGARGPELVADGEVVAFAGGVTSFARLQQRMQIHDPQRARRSPVAVFFYLFDLLHLDGHDITALPLRARKRLLRRTVVFGGRLRFTPHRNAEGEEAYRRACARGWEGLIAKRADSPYRRTRSREWLKLKCLRAQEFVIGGWTEPRGSRKGLGALLVGYHEDGRLRYAGKVGTGFDDATLAMLRDALAQREIDRPPFAGDGRPRGARWARPELVAQIGFTEWTRDGRLRHPRYLGLRDDKPAREVVREHPAR